MWSDVMWLFVNGGRYVEPSIRPDDSRYGENPNRLQKHTQFQVILLVLPFRIKFFLFLNISSFPSCQCSTHSCKVILKPDPGNSQDLFIRSLSALGSIFL